MLSRLFNLLSARYFWKNQIFTIKKLLQTLNYRKIAIVELEIAVEQMSYNGNFFAAILFAKSKGLFEPHNSLKLSLTNI